MFSGAVINVAVVIYLIGAALGLLVMRDRWPTRLMTALAWPLGLVAFGVVTIVLLAAAAYLWPVPVLLALALLIAAWSAL